VTFARTAAGLGVLTTLAGAGLVAAAVVTTRRLWFGGYISEAGAGAHADWYRIGIFGLALGVLLLGLAMLRIMRSAGLLLVAGGLVGALSGTVSCTEGCPLPPYETPTARDLVHGGASIVSVGFVALAILALALWCRDPRLRRIARIGAWIVVPFIAAQGIAMLAVGRGPVTGTLERGVLTSLTIWILVTLGAVALRADALPRTQEA
jgi:hypothetical protein